MKDLGRKKFCLGLKIEYFNKGIFVHQEAYTMVVRSLDVDKDPFRPQEKDEEHFGPEVPYLSATGAVMYLANYTRPDIVFVVNFLSRYSFSPTRRHWNRVKQILRYLKGTMNMALFYTNDSKSDLIGYANLGYLSYPHND